MKKVLFAIIFVLFVSLNPAVSNGETTLTPELAINGTTSSQTPFVQNGITYIPLNETASKMGDDVSYQSDSQTLVIQKKDNTMVKVTDGQAFAVVNNESIPLQSKELNGVIVPVDAKAIYKDNQMYVPVAFLSDVKGLNYPIHLVQSNGKTEVYVGTYQAQTAKLAHSTVSVKKDGHAIKEVKVYTTQSTKSKSLGTLKKNQNVYLYASQNSWYQVKVGSKKGWVSKSSIHIGKYVAPKPSNVPEPSGAKTYKDGWVAPVLKSQYTGNEAKDDAILVNELGFTDRGYNVSYDIKYAREAIMLLRDDPHTYDVNIVFTMWDGTAGGIMNEAYRVPIVAKELFKFYFDKDGTTVWKKVNAYMNNDNVDKITFTANHRLVKVEYNNTSAVTTMYVGYPNKKF